MVYLELMYDINLNVFINKHVKISAPVHFEDKLHSEISRITRCDTLF